MYNISSWLRFYDWYLYDHFFHFRVNVYSDANKMPIESLARVFGPTIVGSSSTNPANVMRDIHKQKAVS